MAELVKDYRAETVQEHLLIPCLQPVHADGGCFAGAGAQSKYSPYRIFIARLFYCAGVIPDGSKDVFGSQANDDGASVGLVLRKELNERVR